MTYSRAPPFLLSYSLSCNALEVAISILLSFSLLQPRLRYAGCTDESFYEVRVIIPSARWRLVRRSRKVDSPDFMMVAVERSHARKAK